MEITPIAYIHNGFTKKFGIPRQSGLAPELYSKIVFEPEYRHPEALKGLEGFDYIWLLWGFSANQRRHNMHTATWQATVRPPRLGGNTHVGVFSSRSPFRPNPVGLSSVRLERIEGMVLWVSGADLMDGTPIYDIKPYLTYTDSHPDARCGYADSLPDTRLKVVFPENTPLSPAELDALREILSLDPRPSYQDDPDRVYGMSFGTHNIRFTVQEGMLRVTEIYRLPI